MKILNLGCGVKTSDRVINIDWSIYLRIKSNPVLSALANLFLTEHRKRRLADVADKNILVHNLAKGIPFPDESVDAVYHSHLLEHLDRDVALKFLGEIHRVLKPGGIHRIVIPDMEALSRTYLEHLGKAATNDELAAEHDEYISAIIEQSVRRDAAGTVHHTPFFRRMENLIFGDARGRGETHQWMYDRISLAQKLKSTGYEDIRKCDFKTSQIPAWVEIGLDARDDNPNEPHKDNELSLYLEAQKK